MRKLLMLALGVSLIPNARDAHGQGVVCSFGPVTPGYSAAADQTATPAAAKELKRIVSLLCPKGCGHVGLFRNATIPNALTMNVGNGSTKIAYSPSFLDRVQYDYGSDATFGILAHQIGHHVDVNGSPAGWMDPSWNNELRADAWAGCALAKAGLRTDGLKAALGNVGSLERGVEPSWDQRTVAMQRGFDSCSRASRLRLASLEMVSAAKVGGCTSNAECKGGRFCSEGRCQERMMRGVCLKDVDCPDRQVCASTGHCETPRGGAAPDVNAPLAFRARDEGRATGGNNCRKQCQQDRRRCGFGAMKSLNECLARMRSDPEYAGCGCPNWPAAKPECRSVCEDAFEAADVCEANYVPARDACLSSTECASCDSASPGRQPGSRESTFK